MSGAAGWLPTAEIGFGEKAGLCDRPRQIGGLRRPVERKPERQECPERLPDRQRHIRPCQHGLGVRKNSTRPILPGDGPTRGFPQHGSLGRRGRGHISALPQHRHQQPAIRARRDSDLRSRCEILR